MIASRDGTTVAPGTTPVPIAATRPPIRRRRSLVGRAWRWFVTALWFGVAALAIAGLVLIGAIYRQARTDRARPAEAIVVLGTAQYNGWPVPSSGPASTGPSRSGETGTPR